MVLLMLPLKNLVERKQMLEKIQRMGHLVQEIRELPQEDLKFLMEYMNCIINNDYKDLVNGIIDIELEIIKEGFE